MILQYLAPLLKESCAIASPVINATQATSIFSNWQLLRDFHVMLFASIENEILYCNYKVRVNPNHVSFLVIDILVMNDAFFCACLFFFLLNSPIHYLLDLFGSIIKFRPQVFTSLFWVHQQLWFRTRDPWRLGAKTFVYAVHSTLDQWLSLGTLAALLSCYAYTASFSLWIACLWNSQTYSWKRACRLEQLECLSGVYQAGKCTVGRKKESDRCYKRQTFARTRGHVKYQRTKKWFSSDTSSGQL